MARRRMRRTEVVSDEIESLRVVLDFGVEAGEIEPVEDVIFFYFAEIFVPLGREEPRYPGTRSGVCLLSLTGDGARMCAYFE